MTESLYKWLRADRTTPTQKFPWPEDETLWTPNVKPVLCVSGWHGVEEKDVLKHLLGVGSVLYEVEVRGEVVRGGDKFAAESMRFKYVVGEATERNLRLFSCDVAEDVLSAFEAEYPNDHRPRTAIEVARRYALGQATYAELMAADSAAYSAANSAAYWAAYSAARSAADSAADSAAYWAAYSAADWAASAKHSNWLVVRIESGY